MTLSFGVKMPKKRGRGHATSAPENHHLWWKALATTILSLIVTWIFVYYLGDLLSDYLRSGV